MRPDSRERLGGHVLLVARRVHRDAVGHPAGLKGKVHPAPGNVAAKGSAIPADATAPAATRQTDVTAPVATTPAESRIERVYAADHAAADRSARPARRPFWEAWRSLLFASMGLVYFRAVRVKMLPFDNKSEFQVIVDMPEGSTLEQTAAATQALATVVREQPEVTDYPDLRRDGGTDQLQRPRAPLLHAPGAERRRHPGQPRGQTSPQAPEPRDRQVASVPCSSPSRPRFGARIKVAEVPPGPPVLSHHGRRDLRPRSRAAARGGLPGARRSSRRRRGSSTSTGMSRIRSRSSTSASTGRRPRSPGSRRR